MFVFSLVSIFTEIFITMRGDVADLRREEFSLFVIGFFALFSAMEYVFGVFVSRLTSVFASLIPALLLFLLLRNNALIPHIELAMAVAVVIRLLFALMTYKEQVITWGAFVLSVVAVYLCLIRKTFDGAVFTDKLLFVCLAALVLSSAQRLFCEKKNNAFPFYYFVIISFFSLILPMKTEPIDWTKAIEVGERIVSGFKDAADNASYYLSFVFKDDSYTAGYSSFDVTGDRVGKSDKVQLLLETNEKPFFIFKDEETGANMKMRRNVYLSGGRGVEAANVVRYLNFLHSQGADREVAALFSQLSRVNIEYVYLDTQDEIAPINSYVLTNEGRKIEAGVSGTQHKKGYRLQARFLDIDYGSPYLISMLENSPTALNEEDMSFAEANSYMQEIYNMPLDSIMTEAEYERAVKIDEEYLKGYTDTAGSSERMKDLEKELTSGNVSEYEKCKNIETYLRQYPYSTDTAGGHEPGSNMSTAEGMADIADRFLFETQKGYCVHYASSMVMLLRLAGIPARMSVGYRYAYPFEQMETYSVVSNCAHAWPEAYLQGFGWMPFEPTSAYMTAADFSWHRVAAPDKKDIGKNTVYEQPSIPDIPEATKPEPVEQENNTDTTQILMIAAIVALSIILLIVLLIAGTIVIRNIVYRRGNNEKRLSMDVEMIKKVLRKLYKGDFTDRGLLSDYVEIAPFDHQAEIKKVFDIYYRSIYASTESRHISGDEAEMARLLRLKLSNLQ